MTFKAVFPDILVRGPAGHGHPVARRAGFGLQHTDFADRCQRFTGFAPVSEQTVFAGEAPVL